MLARKVLVVGSVSRQRQIAAHLPECEIVPYEDYDSKGLSSPTDLDAIVICCDDGLSLTAVWKFRKSFLPIYLLDGQRFQLINQIGREMHWWSWLRPIVCGELRPALSLVNHRPSLGQLFTTP
ncbi:MAG: hypothetical protein UT11_C0033G0007 [Berkelbacteria bacterium GW2011_GWA2_38_9]|uniref:Uncharacterized protein n=1 Tax=Berkelbacteria bacterium GW2011_GWA2_38_9 TaxID=1618334 RepID=A0A0G0L8M2_9BACT|nr:MAG: hypothetical protein UT11_C0033G0007 [Berkelbacteria bacterium GW2011_GWA2_38_9]